MGKKTDAWRGKAFKPAPFHPLIKLAIKRISVVKKQRETRLSQARSDVVQLLNLGQDKRALVRVEQVIKEQNMVDVLDMMDGYCVVLIERISLIEKERECPDELKEVVSSFLYAASRTGELPEVQEISAILTSHYGKEFASRAIELRNNCGVDHRIIQKLSTRMPDLETRMEALEEIASENGIALQPQEDKNDQNQQPKLEPEANSNTDKEEGESSKTLPEMMEKDDAFSSSMKTRKFRDVAHAAQVAFESAAYAAEAARAAVDLSRSDSHDPNTPSHKQRNLWGNEELRKSKSETIEVEKEVIENSHDPNSASPKQENPWENEEIMKSRSETVEEAEKEIIEKFEKVESSKSYNLDLENEEIEEKIQDEASTNLLKSEEHTIKEHNVATSDLPKNKEHTIEEQDVATNDPLAREENHHFLSHMYTRFRAKMHAIRGN